MVVAYTFVDQVFSAPVFREFERRSGIRRAAGSCALRRNAVWQLELLALIRNLLEERGSTAIYVTHDLREAVALGERIVVIEQGRAVQAGTFQELRARPATPFIRTLVEEVEWTGTTWNPAES